MDSNDLTYLKGLYSGDTTPVLHWGPIRVCFCTSMLSHSHTKHIFFICLAKLLRSCLSF